MMPLVMRIIMSARRRGMIEGAVLRRHRMTPMRRRGIRGIENDAASAVLVMMMMVALRGGRGGGGGEMSVTRSR